MDWMHTNNSPQENFSDRPKTTDARWTVDGEGVPAETMIDLANTTQKDPWFCMPHLATDSYVTQFATLVKNNLDSGRKIYVEYSNEVWNSQFSQGNFVEAQGQAEFATGDSGFTKRLNWHGQRTAEVCDLWQTVFAGDTDRVICVMGSQAANAFTATEAMDCPLSDLAPCHAHNVDAIAIAPYFGGYLGVPDNVATFSSGTLAADVDKIFTEINDGGLAPVDSPVGGSIAETADWIIDNRSEATARGKMLVAYEGGQHLVGVFGAENNNALTNRLGAANRDARMGAAYTEYLNQWEANGGELFVHFTNVSSYSKFGNWGAVERMTELDTPKQNALLDFIGDVNAPPSASAGPNQSADEGTLVSLPGSGADPEEGVLTFEWTQLSGPEVVLSGATTDTASFTAPQVDADTVLTFRLRVTDEAAAFDDDTVNVTVKDAGIAFSAATYTVDETASSATITVLRTGAELPAATVVYVTVSGTATSPADFGFKSATLSFAAEATSATFKVPIVKDTKVEGHEFLKLQLQSPSAGQLGGRSEAVLTIKDNDGKAVFVKATKVSVGEAATFIKVTVQRSGSLTAGATVQFKTSNVTATANADYKAKNLTVNFAPGVASVAVKVTLLPDAFDEADETFKATLSAPTGAVLGTQKVTTVTIGDDD
jgi:hypothetical protein